MKMEKSKYIFDCKIAFYPCFLSFLRQTYTCGFEKTSNTVYL